jgi:DNA polymerase V
LLSDFYESGTFQRNIFDPITEDSKSKELMTSIDKINQKMGKGVWFAAQGKAKTPLEQNHKSPNMTTNWSELPFID